MQGKELLRDMMNTYFMLVTMITALFWVLGTCCFPDVAFGYEAFANPLSYAACGTIPNVVMYSKKELTGKQYVVRKVIQLVLVEIIVMWVALPVLKNREGWVGVAALLALSVLLIFVLTHVVEWFQDSVSAKKMNEDLLLFQQIHES